VIQIERRADKTLADGDTSRAGARPDGAGRANGPCLDARDAATAAIAGASPSTSGR